MTLLNFSYVIQRTSQDRMTWTPLQESYKMEGTYLQVPSVS